MQITYAEVTLSCPCGEELDWSWQGCSDDIQEIEAEAEADATNRGVWDGEFCLTCGVEQALQLKGER